MFFTFFWKNALSKGTSVRFLRSLFLRCLFGQIFSSPLAKRGIVGLAMVSVNYFIYKSILKRRKDKYRAEILELSSRILGE